jgi:2-keto-3-deoxy-galactonokinase
MKGPSADESEVILQQQPSFATRRRKLLVPLAAAAAVAVLLGLAIGVGIVIRVRGLDGMMTR